VMLSTLFPWIGWAKLGAVAVLGALVAAGPVYLYGHARGRAAERAAVLERSLDLLRERNATDDAVESMGDADLCRALGGVPVDGRCE
jgi:hypothetical protein